jgi:hypothetical protein
MDGDAREIVVGLIPFLYKDRHPPPPSCTHVDRNGAMVVRTPPSWTAYGILLPPEQRNL